MNIRKVRVLQGPNVWAACPVLEVDLDVAGTDPLALAESLVAEARQPQKLAVTPVSFTAVRHAGPGRVLAAVEFAASSVAKEAIEIACRLLTAPGSTPVQPTDDDLKRLRALEYQQRIPPTVATTYFGAKNLGVPV